MFDIRIDGKKSIYEQIYDEVSRLIAAGILEPDEKLPTVRETAKAIGVNPNTVQRAYAMLEQNGLIYSVPAKGSYVSSGGAAAKAVNREARDTLRTAMRKASDAGVTRKQAEEIMTEIWGIHNDGGKNRK